MSFADLRDVKMTKWNKIKVCAKVTWSIYDKNTKKYLKFTKFTDLLTEDKKNEEKKSIKFVSAITKFNSNCWWTNMPDDFV